MSGDAPLCSLLVTRAREDLVEDVEVLIPPQLLHHSHVFQQVHSDGAANEGALGAKGEVDEFAEAGRVVVAVRLCVGVWWCGVVWCGVVNGG